MWSKFSQKLKLEDPQDQSKAKSSALELRRRKTLGKSPKIPLKFLERTQMTNQSRVASTSQEKGIVSNDRQAYQIASSAFTERFPEYKETGALDKFRKQDFTRLKKNPVVYVDYMGGCLYPESLVKRHMEQLSRGVYGNTHSDSPSSTASDQQVRRARTAVLRHFSAPSDEYVCIFTANCTAALKLVGESFPFEPSSRFILAEDSHNSVNGIRAFAEAKGATVRYAPAIEHGGFNEEDMIALLREAREREGSPSAASLIAITGQSNISGFRPHLPTLLSAAKNSGHYTLLDGAALASTTSISLGSRSDSNDTLQGKVDALAISFYKLFGYPTGVGALIARKDFLKKLRKPWFSGGTVEVVGMPRGVTETEVDWERFEEGTINYTSLMVIPHGLELLRGFIESPKSVLPRRLRTLHIWLHHSLQEMRHKNGTPLVTIMTADPASPTIQNGKMRSNGYVLSVLFYDSSGERIPNSEISRRAAKAGISLRTGCVCNPGGAAGLLLLREKWQLVQEAMANSSEQEVVRLKDVERMLGWEVGVVRISLGLVSNFRDVWEIAKFASTFIQ